MKHLFLSIFILFSQAVSAQYTLHSLTQEAIKRTKTLTIEPNPKKYGDTVLTIYAGSSIEVLHYFVDDNIITHGWFEFCPNGFYLNGQHFYLYEDMPKTEKQKEDIHSIKDFYEFTLAGRNYLHLYNKCTGSGYKGKLQSASNFYCSNIFDITNPEKITQISFPSIWYPSLGDFNADGLLDFIIRTKGYPIKVFTKFITGYIASLYAYTFNEGIIKLLENETTQEPNYIYAAFDEKQEKFNVLFHNWFIPLKNSKDSVMALPDDFNLKYAPLSFYARPQRYIFTPEDKYVEQDNYSVIVGKFNNNEQAKKLCAKLQSKNLGESCPLFITMTLSNQIKWLVLVGNYATKREAKNTMKILKRQGYKDTAILEVSK